VSYDRSTVEAVVSQYFDGLYEGDIDKLGAIFHPSADLRSLDKGKLQILPVPKWLERVKQRPSAKPTAAALFHGLPGGDETQGRMADRFEILPLRSAGVRTAGTSRRASHLSPGRDLKLSSRRRSACA
jgi:hypothetical protein